MTFEKVIAIDPVLAEPSSYAFLINIPVATSVLSFVISTIDKLNFVVMLFAERLTLISMTDSRQGWKLRTS